MRYEKALSRAKTLAALSNNPNMDYAVRGREGYELDYLVVQFYKNKPAGIAAY